MACGSDKGETTPTPTNDTGTTEVATETGPDAPADIKEGGTSCTSARDTAVGPIDKVSTGEVKVLDDAAGVKTLYVDASAGGFSGAKDNPWIYVALSTSTRVDINDRQSFTSTDWDLALKRAVLHPNSGHVGVGGGGAQWLPGKSFDTVTAADATSIKVEAWFDKDCTLIADAVGAPRTTFDGWYDYDGATTKVTPKAGVFVVRGAKGELYKLEILSYYANPDGTAGTTSGRYKLRVAPLK